MSSIPAEVPACFGEMWEAIGESACVGCSLRKECLEKFSRHTLPRKAAELGDKASPETLAAQTGVKMEAILVAISHAQNAPGDDEPVVAEIVKSEAPAQAVSAVAPPPVPPPVMSGPPPPPGGGGMEAPPVVAGSVSSDAPPVGAAETRISAAPPAGAVFTPPGYENNAVPTVVVNDPPQPEVQTEDESEGESEHTVAKKKKKTPAKKKKKAAAKKTPAKKKKATAVTPNPTTAGTAKSAKVSVKKKKAPARRAKAQAHGEWGNHTYKERWARERKRTPVIGALVPGMKLHRTYKGESYTLLVKSGHYLFNSKKFPTLYAVTKAITGTHEVPRKNQKGKVVGTKQLCNWSATRFWNIRAAMRKLSSK